MKVLFAHNIRLKEDNLGNLYTHSSYNEKIWNRYHTLSEDITILARKEEQIYEFTEAKKRFSEFKRKYTYYDDIHKSVIDYLNIFKRIKNNSTFKRAVNHTDVLIARVPSYAGEKTIQYARKYNIPYIVEVVACTWDGLWNHSVKGKIIAPFSYLKVKKIIRDSPYVIYVTNHFLQNRYPTLGESVNCSNVLLTSIDKKTLQKRLRKVDKIKSDSKIIIGTTAAVDVKYKGQQYVIEMLGKLKKEGNTKYRYELVGSGDKEFLEKIVKENNVEELVSFKGEMSHDQVFNWLDTIDVYIQPSKQEGLPRALIEAMSRGVLCIGSKTAGIPELLEKEYIYKNDKKKVDSLIKILESLDTDQMKEQAIRNFKEASQYQEKIIMKKRSEFLNIIKDRIHKENKA